jgi:hypothetical protein
MVIKVKHLCVSACTLVLVNPKACAELGSVFGFHQAVDENGKYPEHATKLVWGLYPAKVRTKVGKLTPDMAYIKGTELLPVCP